MGFLSRICSKISTSWQEHATTWLKKSTLKRFRPTRLSTSFTKMRQKVQSTLAAIWILSSLTTSMSYAKTMASFWTPITSFCCRCVTTSTHHSCLHQRPIYSFSCAFPWSLQLLSSQTRWKSTTCPCWCVKPMRICSTWWCESVVLSSSFTWHLADACAIWRTTSQIGVCTRSRTPNTLPASTSSWPTTISSASFLSSGSSVFPPLAFW